MLGIGIFFILMTVMFANSNKPKDETTKEPVKKSSTVEKEE
jgi:hypothetical protein